MAKMVSRVLAVFARVLVYQKIAGMVCSNSGYFPT